MAKFKIGDEVVVISHKIGSNIPIGEKFIVDNLNDNTSNGGIYFPKGKSGMYGDDLELSNKIYKTMSMLEKFALARKGEPEKSFIKAGITKLDGSFTTEGQSIFLSYLLEKNGTAFKTDVVDALLADEEKE